ncbi:MAG: Gfo/Idh/MocA family protein [Opitutales bacterium]
MSKAAKVRVGIIGIGNMGTAHSRSILDGNVPEMRLTAVCDSRPEAASKVPGVPFYEMPDQVLKSGEIDAVIIATPHYDHTTLGILALEAGLHVMVEKPISVHKADCQRLIAAHRNDRQIFAAMFNQRGDPRYQKLKALIDGGELGRINRLNWIITDWFRTETYYASGGWRATWAGEGGGVLLNQCPHQLDLWQWLFGMPQRVRGFCQVGRFHKIEVEDDVTAYFEYEDGSTGVFITTTGEAPGTNRLEIAAERGRVIVDEAGLHWVRNEVASSDFSRTTTGSFTKPETWDVRLPVEGRGEQHLGILKNFVAAIRDGMPLVAPAAEGIHSVELANAILQSHFEDRTIDLPLDAESYERLLKKKIASSTFVKTTKKVDTSDFGLSF